MKIIRKLIKWAVLLILILILVIWIAITNFKYDKVEYTVSSDRLPAAFEGFRIAQISDLHSRSWASLPADVEAGKPDIIIISGDLVSRGDSSLPEWIVEQLVSIAPVYFAPGNHEADNKDYAALRDKLISLGVTVLEDDGVVLTRPVGPAQGSQTDAIQTDRAESVRICGVVDPMFKKNSGTFDGDLSDAVEGSLCATVDGSDMFTILISHRPEFMMLYEAHSVDVVFAGHAHGGAVQLPFIGAVWAPGQGFFPAYVGGVYESEYTSMVVSRGLSKSTEAFHVNCPFELVFCTLTQG